MNKNICHHGMINDEIMTFLLLEEAQLQKSIVIKQNGFIELLSTLKGDNIYIYIFIGMTMTGRRDMLQVSHVASGP